MNSISNTSQSVDKKDVSTSRLPNDLANAVIQAMPAHIAVTNQQGEILWQNSPAMEPDSNRSKPNLTPLCQHIPLTLPKDAEQRFLSISIKQGTLFTPTPNSTSVEKKRSEFINQMRYLEIIGDWVPANLYWLDLNGRILGANKPLREIFSNLGWHDYIGKTTYDYLPADAAQHTRKIDLRVIETQEVGTFQEEGFDTKGNRAVYHSSKVPILNEDGELIGLLGVSIDITDRIRTEESLEKAKAAAELSSAAKNDFLMNMSHDLRTPFMGIMGSTEILYETEDDPDRKELLHIVLKSSRRLLHLIDEIVDVASWDPKDLENLQLFNLSTMCADLATIMAPQTEQKGVKLNVHIDPSLSPLFYGNKMALQRILLNLLGNAVKFTRKGEINLTVKPLSQSGEKHLIEISVSDTGIGMPPGVENLIFHKFHRLSPTASGEFKGTGLGLYFVKNEIDRMGGNIHVESTLGEGSTFTCQIPLSTEKNES